jgi:hypothetical protein
MPATCVQRTPSWLANPIPRPDPQRESGRMGDKDTGSRWLREEGRGVSFTETVIHMSTLDFGANLTIKLGFWWTLRISMQCKTQIKHSFIQSSKWWKHHLWILRLKLFRCIGPFLCKNNFNLQTVKSSLR